MANMIRRIAASNLSRALRPTPTFSTRTSNLCSLSSPRAIKALPSPSTSFLFANRRYLSDATRSAISSATQTSPIVLFMKGTPELPQCGFSRTTLQILGLQGVDPSKFTAFNVLEDNELRQGIKEYSNWPTIPQLYIDGEFVGGCDVIMEMHKDGSLADLLSEKKLIVTEEEAGAK